MRTNWLVVANASRARVLEQTDKVGVFKPVAIAADYTALRDNELARRIAAA